MVAPWVSEEVKNLLIDHPNNKVKIIQRKFEAEDVAGKDMAIAATDITTLNHQVHKVAKAFGVLVNVADTPELCDFYLGSIVTRGNLKVAISTNGQSPTFAKRFRQVLEDILPENTDGLLSNLKVLRDRLKGNFTYKVKKLNELTASLVEKSEVENVERA